MNPNPQIGPLGPHHDRAAFSCEKEPLEKYLKTQATQAVEKNLAAVFVYADGARIIGYYTLSSFTVKLDEIPPEIAKKLTRMPLVPATLIGRLARHVDSKGKRIGEILLVDALKRAYRNSLQVASWAVIADAKDDKALEFYKTFGFISFPTIERRVFLPMASLADLYDDGEDDADARADAADEKTPAARMPIQPT